MKIKSSNNFVQREFTELVVFKLKSHMTTPNQLKKEKKFKRTSDMRKGSKLD